MKDMTNMGIDELTLRIIELESVLEQCATHPVNSDTCGVCGEHFEDCEKDIVCIGDDADEHDIPTGRTFGCPGARARRVLEGKSVML